MKLPTELPHLEGRWGRVVGWVFIALPTLAALLAVGGTIFTGIDDFRNIPVDGGYGFRSPRSPNRSPAPFRWRGSAPHGGRTKLRSRPALPSASSGWKR